MRICSLLPSATEIVADLGLVESLVGISEECDWPPEVRGLPVVTASRVETTRLTSLEIDRAVREAVGDGRPLYAIDRALLETLQPDLILTQNLCAVCAVSADNVNELCATDAESSPSTRTRSPRSRDASSRSPTCSACQHEAAPSSPRWRRRSQPSALAWPTRRRDRCSSPSGSSHPTPQATGSPRWWRPPAAATSSDTRVPFRTRPHGKRCGRRSPNWSSSHPAASTIRAQPARRRCRHSLAAQSPSTRTPTTRDQHRGSPMGSPNSPFSSTPTSSTIPDSPTSSSPPQHRLHRRSSVTSPADHRAAATLGPAGSPSSGDRSLTVAFLHLAPELGALNRNRSLIEYGTRVAADSGADWVLSGELCVSGYRFEAKIGTNWIAEQPDSWMRRLARLSSDLGVASFVSHPERETLTGKLFNSLFVIGRNGQILGRNRKLKPTPGSEAWSSAGEPGRPIPVDGIKTGLLVCADAYKALPALRLRDSGAQLLVSSAAWWPGEWGPKGEWEARTLDTGLPMIVCNRTGCDHESQLFGSESVVVDRGEKLLTLRATESTVFIVNCRLRQGHIAKCELIKSIVLKRE